MVRCFRCGGATPGKNYRDFLPSERESWDFFCVVLFLNEMGECGDLMEVSLCGQQTRIKALWNNSLLSLAKPHLQ